MKLKITLPRELKSLPVAQREKLLGELQKALDIKAPTGAVARDAEEHNVWMRNEDELLGQAEDDFYLSLVNPWEATIIDVMDALELPITPRNLTEIDKSFGEYYDLIKAKDKGRSKMSDLISVKKEERDKFLKYIQEGQDWSKTQLKKLDAILKQKLPEFGSLAEEFSIRAGFIAKVRDKADQERLNMVGAIVDRFPKTIKAAEKKGIVLTVREQEKAKAAGKRVKILPLTPQELRAVDYASMQAADKITEVSDKHRAQIRQMIIRAHKERWSAQKLAQELYDQFADQNRDWRRVAITELAMASSDAFIAGCAEGDEVWVPPVPGACKHCVNLLEGKTFIVTHDPEKIGNGHAFKYIWPGKSNYGRRAASWVPCIPLHPNCRHRYHKKSRFYETDASGKQQLRSLKDLINEERARRGLPPDPNLV